MFKQFETFGVDHSDFDQIQSRINDWHVPFNALAELLQDVPVKGSCRLMLKVSGSHKVWTRTNPSHTFAWQAVTNFVCLLRDPLIITCGRGASNLTW